MSSRVRCRTLSACCLLVVAATIAATPPPAVGSGQEFLPPEHWAYRALERFETLGIVELPSHRPFSRPDVVRYIESIDASELSARDRWELDRLHAEFTRADVRDNPKARYDRPLLYATEDPVRLEGDLDLSLVPDLEAFDPRWEFYGVTNPEVRAHIGDHITGEVRYRLVMGPEHDDRARDRKPSPREKSFKGLTSLYERAYVVGSYRTITAFWGREYVGWGAAEDGNLLLSQTAGSLDRFGGRIRFKNFVLLSTHAKLSADIPRNVSIHRLEMRFGGIVIGVAESVVYAQRGFDPIYLLPLSIFYVNQFNERENSDNILWSIDAKLNVAPGLQLFGGLLVDDFQFERDGENPDKLGFDAGARAAIGGPMPATLRLQYRFVDIYTYSHRDSLNRYVTGVGDPAAGDASLGAPEGPDADRVLASVDVYPWPTVTARLLLVYGRAGEGNDFRAYQAGESVSPPFPSGTVAKTLTVGASALWELSGNSSAAITVTGTRAENREGVPAAAEWSPGVRVRVTWDM